MSLDWVPGLDLSTGTFTLPLWAVGVALALLLALAVIAVVRSGVSEFGSLIFRVAVIAIALVFGWTYLNRTAEQARAEERRALDQRAADLVGRAIAPGSAIACLEATNTETVEGSCERAVFASPETVAAATAYISARLTLLSDANDYVSRKDQAYESVIAGLRRTIAADRYGLASQVLATRDGCSADTCDAFTLVYDDKKLRVNLKDRLFDITVARYATNWPARSARPVASSSSPSPTTPSLASSNSVPAPPPPAPSSGVSFPSSQSIPPVSIMNAEPAASAPAPQGQANADDPDAAKPPTNSAPASASRRPAPKAAAKAAAKSAPSGQAPMSLNPTKQ